ncbi:hypothetical protein A6R68_03546 [Neotoma lepida]|uniref:Uncharacterized protein n=1 Tax=Neotoma lepida TaxID=56216 RepID=A0A1A6GRC3_NEOLE|nr:hypothetical protein A6R68_03546 [Neotoma lepida]
MRPEKARIILNHCVWDMSGNIGLRLSQTIQTHHKTARHRKLEGFHLTISTTVLLLPTQNFQRAPFLGTDCAL